MIKKLAIAVLLAGWVIHLAVASAASKDIILGMSADFTGPNKGLGAEFYLGADCYFRMVNQNGGIHGRKIVIKAYDDGYDPEPAVNNTIRLIEDGDVFALFNYVGTPTTTRILPLLKHYHDRTIWLFTPLTGAQPVLDNEYIFSLRASYSDEISKMVDELVKRGFKKVAVLHQLDAYGRGGWQSISTSLKRHGLEIAGEATYERGSSFNTSFNDQVSILKKASPDAIISVAAYEPAAAFIRDARNAGLEVPILNLSFVNAKRMHELLTSLESGSSEKYTSNLINTQVVPFYGFEDFDPVQKFSSCMDTFKPGLPEGIDTTAYTFKEPGAVGFEGFLNAWFLSEILEQMGPDIERKIIREVLDQPIKSYPQILAAHGYPEMIDTGNVYFISFANNQITSVNDLSGLIK
ncbi:ABC transporter substrate-binding protein [Desulfonatronovibrio hydrogenovorans]|uniref:ABC transporter substrate-binding protein n=1 Tax=Desulfonatronovibrio hydrogenovorans TaxID=53245 RepID=UPI00068F2022|nr:ABC transporter substrate-binding protein [Desulfonatronovibrio hydrogenovorans]